MSDAEDRESSADSGASAAKIDVELLEAFVQEAGEHLEAIESYLVAKPGTQGEEAIHGVFRAFHTIKGAAAFLNFEDIGRVAHEMENLLERVRRGEAPLDEKAVDLTLESTDVLKSLILGLRDSVKKGHRAVADRRVTPLVERIRALIGGTAGLAERKPSAAAPAAAPEEPGLHAAITSDTIRVDAERLDRLLDTIGELVIAESMVSQSVLAARTDSRDMETQLRQLDKITRSLQEMSTSLRMVSIRPVFVRMARLVRDLAKRARKPIDFVTSGEDTELDKGIVDRMVDPLIHLLRNAVDHGLEPSPTARRAAGKADAGRIELRAYHRAGSICVEVLDDGRGLDRAKIRDRAVERGLIAPDAAVTDAELVNLIFEPSFSTADVVTEVSGRGVGMDVVRQNVEALRGQIEVSSEPGKGCRVTVRLPLSLAIIDGMVIRVGPEERYIVPTLSIVRTVCLQAEDISSVIERGEMFMMEGHLVPLYRLHDLFNVAGGGAGGDGTLLVLVVEDSGRQLGKRPCAWRMPTWITSPTAYTTSARPRRKAFNSA